MAALVNSLDNYTPKQYGENGHAEYGWSKNIQEQICQFSFQITRTNAAFQIINLEKRLTELITILKYKVEQGSLPERELAKGHLSILFKMIGHTRDIIDGKGEYKLAYMMIYTWFKFYPKLAAFALKCFVLLPDVDNKKTHQYGSWKDLKYFCEYCDEHNETVKETINHPLVQFSIQLINQQLRLDHQRMLAGTSDVSLVAKWTPRENSRFGWLYSALATNYFADFLITAKTIEKQQKAILKCKTEYRKLLASLNRHIDTLQIKQCEQIWQSIDFNKVTSISLLKQKKAFLNIKHNGKPRYPDNFDRIKCAENFNAHIQKSVTGEVEMKGKRIGMEDFTKQAINLIKHGTPAERLLLNSQWRDNSTQTGALGKMIAMVDVSGSMEGDPMNVAIALGIRIAEKSILGKRVMTFSAKPTWVNLEPYTDFISQVSTIKEAEWGMNTNFHAALDMILDAIVQNKLPPEDVQDMVLVILSDMQMDHGDNCNKAVLYESMKKKYEDAGIRVHGAPYRPPHILFWNLRSTSGFPSLSNQPNTSMMAGFSPALLNLFCDQGLDALQSFTPWSILVKSLENERYKIMDNEIQSFLN